MALLQVVRWERQHWLITTLPTHPEVNPPLTWSWLPRTTMCDSERKKGQAGWHLWRQCHAMVVLRHLPGVGMEETEEERWRCRRAEKSSCHVRQGMKKIVLLLSESVNHHLKSVALSTSTLGDNLFTPYCVICHSFSLASHKHLQVPSNRANEMHCVSRARKVDAST